MSVSPSLSPRSRYAEPTRPASTGRRSVGTAWFIPAAVVAILAASGGVRSWQSGRIEQSLEVGRSSPFPLADLPMALGSWRGHDEAMDPQIVRITGSTDLVARRYVDRQTGVGLDVIVLYGPASDVVYHVPEVCYPSAGFTPLPGVFERPIAVGGDGHPPAPFRSLAFARGEGGLADVQEVYYGFRQDGRWTTRSAGLKASRRLPGMFKVQVSRRISDRERRDVDNPCEPFLAVLVGEIEARLAGTRSGPSPE